MSDKKADQNAFPLAMPGNDFYESGLTKRELFAAMAMQGLLSGGHFENAEAAAGYSIKCADALLAELEK